MNVPKHKTLHFVHDCRMCSRSIKTQIGTFQTNYRAVLCRRKGVSTASVMRVGNSKYSSQNKPLEVNIEKY